jgi:sulfatase modifying factor 1
MVDIKGKIVVTILCCVCAVLPTAAQTAAPEGMALVPAGKFWMGRYYSTNIDATDQEMRGHMDDRPANNVYLDAFYMDKYEVTSADYAEFVEATGTRAPWHWRAGEIPDGEERFPVTNVNWFEGAAFCEWAGKRLPTEAEWEKAARGGLDRMRYTWGDEDVDTSEARLLPPRSARRLTDDPVPGVHRRNTPLDVGSFEANGYVLYDMSGNVTEWTSDWYDKGYYAFMPKRNPQGPENGLYKSVRGTNFVDGVTGDRATANYRNFTDAETRTITIAFRCAKDREQ